MALPNFGFSAFHVCHSPWCCWKFFDALKWNQNFHRSARYHVPGCVAPCLSQERCRIHLCAYYQVWQSHSVVNKSFNPWWFSEMTTELRDTNVTGWIGPWRAERLRLRSPFLAWVVSWYSEYIDATVGSNFHVLRYRWAVHDRSL